jgi:isoleucyl-tRNA synthetase
VLAADGTKMSKQKGNYTAPELLLDQYGADALRAYLINSQLVRAEPLRFVDEGVKEVVRTVLLPLHHAHAFFVQYANVDGWTPKAPRPPVSERPELDRWVLSHLQTLIASVDREMEEYRLYNVVPPVLQFIEDLTNWYIRLSRRRFWRPADSDEARADKAAAYATLYEALVTFCRVLAPFLPFASEAVYQSLVVAPGQAKPGEDSVHLTDWPQVKEALVDRELEHAVAQTREVVRLGRKLRERKKFKTRQPLRLLTVVHHDAAVRQAVAAHQAQIKDELNVKEVVVRSDGDELASVSCKANFKTLGKRFGKEMKEAAKAIEGFGKAELSALEGGQEVAVLGQGVRLEDVVVRRESRAGTEIETEGSLLVALDFEVDQALLHEGVARELVSTIQKMRKDAGLSITQRISVSLDTDDELVLSALEGQRSFVANEVLATRIERAPVSAEALALSSVQGEHQVRLLIQAV